MLNLNACKLGHDKQPSMFFSCLENHSTHFPSHLSSHRASDLFLFSSLPHSGRASDHASWNAASKLDSGAVLPGDGGDDLPLVLDLSPAPGCLPVCRQSCLQVRLSSLHFIVKMLGGTFLLLATGWFFIPYGADRENNWDIFFLSLMFLIGYILLWVQIITCI